MPVVLNPKHPGPERRSDLDGPRVPSAALAEPRGYSLHIGLVNNMADKAMGATEHQFLTLLEAAAGDMPINVTLYALPEVERSAAGQRRVSSFYFGTEQLWELPPDEHPDALIVTGREPRARDLRDEPYWPGFERVVAWTQEFSRSAVWSCLAAHAAVLALDGIERVPSAHKHFGIFACEQVAEHLLLAGAPAALRVPHSRWNGLCSSRLAAHGYQVLTCTSDGTVDTFIKQDRGLSIFFQGHPEYEPETLLGEYRRDAARYLRGERETYPLLPRDYFDGQTEQRLLALAAAAGRSRSPTLVDQVSSVLAAVRIQNTWRSTAVSMYRNWLEHLCAVKRHGG